MGDLIFERRTQDVDGTLLPDLPIEKYTQMSPVGLVLLHYPLTVTQVL